MRGRQGGHSPHSRRQRNSLFNRLPVFEACFVLFLFAGQFKADPRLTSAVDLTLLFFFLSGFLGVLVVARSPRRAPRQSAAVLALYFAFAAWCSLSLVWSPLTAYSIEKGIRLLTIVLWCVVGSALVLNHDRLRRFLLVMLVVACLAGIEVWSAYASSNGLEALRAFGASYIGTGRLLGAGAIIAAAFWLPTRLRRTIAMRAILPAIFLALAGLLFVVGSRGAFFALLGALMLPLLTTFRLGSGGLLLRRHGIPMLLVLLVTAGAIGYMWQSDEGAVTIQRMKVLTTPDLGPSAGVRADNYGIAAELWMERPLLGHGIGAWPVLTESDLDREYPHNLILEVLVETGVVGLSLLVALIRTSWRALGGTKRVSEEPTTMAVAMLFVFFFLNAMVSGDIPDNRLLFVAMGLAAVAGRRIGGGRATGPDAMHVESRLTAVRMGSIVQ